MLEVLKKLDFSAKESLTYMVLLKYGTRQTSFVSKKANLNRGTAYVALHSLLDKGFVVKSVKRKVQYFTALPPRRLLEYIDDKEREVAGQKTLAASIVPQLEKMASVSLIKPKIELFEAREGARVALEDTLNCKERTMRAFLSISDIADFLGSDFFERYTDKRVERGPSLNAIRTLEKDEEAFKRNKFAKRYKSNPKERREVRHVSNDFAFPMSMYLYDDKILAISSKEENFAVIIESRELCEMQKKLFDSFWHSLKNPA